MTLSSPIVQAPHAERLQGLTVSGSTGTTWRVSQIIPRNRPGATGGHFSVGYLVDGPNGSRAFLKALDLSSAFQSGDPVTSLHALTTAFKHERELLEQCRDRRMDRVVLAVDHGQVAVDPVVPSSVVPFIIFELAEGDARAYINFSKRFDAAWALRSLHHVATGLVQLHRHRIAHQDLKPSNVMLFESGASAKLGDLGRASQAGQASLHDGLACAGDRTYAPPELLYGAPPQEWSARRMGCDAYLFGSLVVFYFSGSSMTALLMNELPASHRWHNWSGTFSAVLPFLRDAFDRAVTAFAQQVPEEFRADVEATVRQLCDPNPDLRGHPRERAMRHGNPHSLDRYVAQLDLLARRAERGVRVLPSASGGLGQGTP